MPVHDPAARQGPFASELGVRVASAVVLAIVALLATYEGGWAFALFWAAAGSVTAVEWTAMTRVAPQRPVQAILIAGLVALCLVSHLGLGLGAGTLALATAAAVAAAVAAKGRDRLWALAGLAYAAVIAVVPPLVRNHPELGLVGLLWMFAVVWATDIAAFFTGRALGGPKLWPRVSPKKTWSGFFGGLIAGVAAGLAVAAAADRLEWAPPVGFATVAVVSAVGSVVSQLGDLGESALKRRFEVKDSGRLIPGHGGVMDRIDGFWAVALLIGLILFGASVLSA